MNITYYTHYFIPEIGAPSARLYDFSREWIASGYPVQVMTCFPNHPTGKLYPGYSRKLYLKEKIDGIKIHRNWTYITPNRGFIKKSIGHISLLASAALVGNHRQIPPDIVIGSSPTFFAAMAAAWAGIKLHIPFIMEVRDLWPAIFIDLDIIRNRYMIGLLERLEMALYRQATRVVTVTEAFRRNLIERGIPSNKVITIPNGADTDFWKPENDSNGLRSQLGLENDFVVLYIGAHGISQALGRVLEAANLLKENHRIRFVMVGEGAEKQDLIREYRKRGLDNILFHDPVDRQRVKDFYSIADVCLVPLRDIPLFDGFIPSKMFEIMSMERPIIASLKGESATILNKSGAAVVVHPEDSNAMAKAILELYRNKDHTRHMGKKGRAFVEAEYSRKSLAKTYLETMKEAMLMCGNR